MAFERVTLGRTGLTVNPMEAQLTGLMTICPWS